MSNKNKQDQNSNGQPFESGSDSAGQRAAICRKFIKGTCIKHHSQCILRHELDIDVMQEELQFCHDHQNHGCIRKSCTFLHTTKEEEKLFKTNGVIPQVLAEKYSAMAATANMSNPETVQQIAMYINESFGGLAGQPPPPPPPPLLMPPPPPPPPEQRPVQQLLPHVAPQLAPPPPPPATTAPAIRPNSVYPSIQNRASNFTNNPPPIMPPFDASVPPPPFYQTHVNQLRNVKRPSESNEAGPSKLRKAGVSTSEMQCSECVQKEQSIGLYKKGLDQLHTEEEHQSLIYRNKVKQFEDLLSVLKALVDPEMFRLWEMYIEDVPQQRTQAQDVVTQLGQIASLASNNSMTQLLAFFLKHRGMLDTIEAPTPAPPPSVRLDESLLHTLSSLQRRITTPSSVASYDLRMPIDSLRHAETDRTQLHHRETTRPETVASSSGSNSICLSSGQKTVEQTTPQAMYSGPVVGGSSGANTGYPANFYSAVATPGYTNNSSRYPGIQGNIYPAVGPTPGSSGVTRQSQHPTFHPGVPPPIPMRPYYGSYSNTNNPRAAVAPPPPRTPCPPQDNSGRYNQYPSYPPYHQQYQPNQ